MAGMSTLSTLKTIELTNQRYTSLAIAHDSDTSGYFLLYFTNGVDHADTFHLSLEDALHQAEYEFNVTPAQWKDVG
jgi:hypothetical protein